MTRKQTARTGSPPRLDEAEWLLRQETQAVLAALNGNGHETRVVGGAVRNALLGIPVADIDFATTAVPDDVIARAQAAGLHSVPTGLPHGTVTVIAGRIPFEVTTLRRDVETFGRHATVSFTADWTEDARRRDFTINALYCAADGTVYDPLEGYSDLIARRIRFIGDARARIAEDYLRILRFFRFSAEYGVGAPDADSLAACLTERAGLGSLSGERIRAELLRLLVARRAHDVVALMAASGLIGDVTGGEASADCFSRLCEIEVEVGRPADAILRLAALAARVPSDAMRLQERLRLSSAETRKMFAALTLRDEIERWRSPAPAKALLYRHGADTFVDAVLLAAASGLSPLGGRSIHDDLALARDWTPPVPPFKGGDLIALGVPPGPALGRALTALEEWWIANDFPSDASLLRAKLTEIVAQS